jgi:outer membrane immunogenic protein
MSRIANSFGVALAAVLASPAALAADLPSLKAAPVAPPPVFSWTGFYLGFNHGFGGGVVDANVNLANPFLLTTTRTVNRANGFFAGGEAGYQIQFQNNVVLGVETDMQWSDVKASHQATNYASTGLAGYSYSNINNSLDWFGTTRLRVGYSFGRLLPYVTGGVAYGGTSATGQQVVGGAVIGGSSSQTNVGWAAGAGLDYALSDNLSARAEYIYVQLANASGPALGFAPAFPPLVGSFTTGAYGVHLLRTGINWKFDRFGLPPTGDLLGMLWAAPTVDWTGFYVGVNGGYGGETLDASVNLASPLPLATYTQTQNHSSGFLFGGQAGYNRQISSHVVVGVETDAQWSNVTASHQATTAPALVLTDISNGFDWFGTTRARLGWAAGSTLAYVTGGVAYGDVYARGLQISGGLFSGSVTQTKVGWTVGAGAEYALNENLSLKAEYLYMDFSGVSGAAYGLVPPAAPVAGSFSTGSSRANVARLGLNWKFGGLQAAAPILAKY